MKYLLIILLFVVGCSLDDSKLTEENKDKSKDYGERMEFCTVLRSYSIHYYASKKSACEESKLQITEEYERVVAKLTTEEARKFVNSNGVNYDCQETMNLRQIESNCMRFQNSAWGWRF